MTLVSIILGILVVYIFGFTWLGTMTWRRHGCLVCNHSGQTSSNTSRSGPARGMAVG